MKSYFLDGLEDDGRARHELSVLLPLQVNPWVIQASEYDTLAYLNVIACDAEGLHIAVDISGRHYDQDDVVIALLRQLQERLGGVIHDDHGNEL